MSIEGPFVEVLPILSLTSLDRTDRSMLALYQKSVQELHIIYAQPEPIQGIA
jgi:hypothetical protein